MKRPRWIPRWLFGFVTGTLECCDCHLWVRQSSNLNPDVCTSCLFDRMLVGIAMESRMRMWGETLSIATRAAADYYADRAKLQRLKDDLKEQKLRGTS